MEKEVHLEVLEDRDYLERTVKEELKVLQDLPDYLALLDHLERTGNLEKQDQEEKLEPQESQEARVKMASQVNVAHKVLKVLREVEVERALRDQKVQRVPAVLQDLPGEQDPQVCKECRVREEEPEILDPREKRESPVPEGVMACLVKMAEGESLVQQDLLAQQVLVVAPGTEENKALPVLLASLELLDKTESLVGKEKKALLVSEASKAPPGQQVLLEAPERRVPLVHKEPKESVEVQVFQVRLAFLVLAAYPVHLATMATLDHPALQVQEAKTDLRAPLGPPALLGPQEVLVQKGNLAHPVKEAQLVHEENRVKMENQDPTAAQESEALQVHRVLLDLVEHLENPAE
ncbi:UNVERIFIED_CONTAM: hypothetical protein K2H54_050290, partial [Gekko kuhli]